MEKDLLPHEIAREKEIALYKDFTDEDWEKQQKGCNRIVMQNIISREEAYEYVATHDLKVNYRKELRDGTPRRIWELRDPGGEVCGSMITAIGLEGTKNHSDYTKDAFDFMEILIDRVDFLDPDTTISPRTNYFKNQESEE
jgi:hypothetical protein